MLYVKDIEILKKVVKDSFRFKRKTIKNNLKEYNLEIVLRVLEKYGYGLDVRAEALSLSVFVDLANELV